MTTLAKSTATKKLTDIVSALFILLFVYTACSKLLAHNQFQGMLTTSPLLGSFAGFIAVALPISELIISLLLFSPGTRKTGLLLSLVLMVAFTSYIIYMMIFASHLPCSCGGVIQKLTWKQHVFLNMLLILLLLTVLHPNKIFIAINRGIRKPVEKSR